MHNPKKPKVISLSAGLYCKEKAIRKLRPVFSIDKYANALIFSWAITSAVKGIKIKEMIVPAIKN